MYRPNPIVKGDTVSILSTARYISAADINSSKMLMNTLGYAVVLGKSINSEYHQFAGTDSERLEDFQNALDDPNIDAIWFAKGGYGSVRIMDQVDWTRFMKKPKWLAGFSDMTIWHNVLNQVLAVESIHSIMPSTFDASSNNAKQSLINVLEGKLNPIVFSNNNANKNVKTIDGQLIGGNLSILYSMLGTNSGWNTKGKILFIEEIDEYLYHIDRMMMSIKKAGKLNGLKAMIVGGFTDIRDNVTPFGMNYKEIILDHCQEFNFPVFFDFPAGHIENNLPLVLGAKIKLTPNKETITLTYK